MKPYIKLTGTALVFILISCGNKQNSASIVGKWEYDRLEKAPATKPEDAAKMDADNKGHTIEFFKDGKFVSLTGGHDTLSKGTYEYIQERNSLLTHTKDMSSGGDSVKVVDLTQAQLKFQAQTGDLFYMKRLH